MQAAVVVFPGSNAEVEMVRTLRDIVGVPTELVWHKDRELPPNTDLVAIPGGFSYGDYLRAGAIAKAGAIVPAIRRHAERGGYVLGVCNGFQVLTEIGLLPGALTRNQHLRFECRDLHVVVTAERAFHHWLSGGFAAADRARRGALPRGRADPPAARERGSRRFSLLRPKRNGHDRNQRQRLGGGDRRDLRRTEQERARPDAPSRARK